MTRLKTYFSIWKIMGTNALQEAFVNRYSNLLFFAGKIIRVAMSLVFLFLIKDNINQFAGYTPDQVVIFFLTYQFIDTLAQIFYRGVYLFGPKVRSGEFDFFLLKPIKPLFQALTGKPDVNDAIFIVPTTVISIWIATTLNITVTFSSILIYLFLLVNSFLIATGFHILVLSMGVITTEVDNVIMLYRDLNRLGQYPVTIYLEPLRFALFFIVPIGLMITIPAEALLNITPTYSLLLTSLVGVVFFLGSLKVWSWSLKRYSSASS